MFGWGGGGGRRDERRRAGLSTKLWTSNQVKSFITLRATVRDEIYV